MPLLSVIVPVYNEVKTIRAILEKIHSVGIDKEIIVIDNSSTDGTQRVLQEILRNKELGDIKVIYHSYNQGKGSSVRDGVQQACGQLIVIQDADLEYDPNEYLNLTKPILEGAADLALGVRFSAGHSGLTMHRLGNKLLTGMVNLLFGARLNDYATCYKMAPKEVFIKLGLKSSSFDIDAEIICKALKNKLRIKEVSISYYPRSYAEGKKIRWADGLKAIVSILKYRFTKK